MLILVTGATGKVGRQFSAGLLDNPRFSRACDRALCHSHSGDATDHVGAERGSVTRCHVAAAAPAGTTHFVHFTRKETPSDVFGVTVKRLFWLLEEFRMSPAARHFILIGEDAGIRRFGSACQYGLTRSTRGVFQH